MINKQKLYSIIFNSDTRHGKRFDVWLLWFILFSVLVAVLDSVPDLHAKFRKEFYLLEWGFTVLFSIEYLLRIYSSTKSRKYIFSFWGIIDLLAILPTYISFFFIGYQYFMVVRFIRLLRVFRILKMVRFNKEAQTLLTALRASSYKIGIFMFTVLTIVVLLGTIMYVVESGENGFTSIPQSIYWAIITITTVGYGDIVPITVLGKFISSISMIIGYAIIAVPTGIITVEMSRASRKELQCPECGHKNEQDANFCNKCGNEIKT